MNMVRYQPLEFWEGVVYPPEKGNVSLVFAIVYLFSHLTVSHLKCMFFLMFYILPFLMAIH